MPAAGTDRSTKLVAVSVRLSLHTLTYVNGIDGTLPGGFVKYTADPLSFDYNREDVYGDVNVNVLIQQPDGTWVPTTMATQ